MKQLFLAATFSAFVGIAHAEKLTVTVIGVGLNSCGSWTEARSTNGTAARVYESWVDGFLSGSNEFILSQLKLDPLHEQLIGDAKGLYRWMDDYCQAHPLNSIYAAADALDTELIRRTQALHR
jgi:hypothetical protein